MVRMLFIVAGIAGTLSFAGEKREAVWEYFYPTWTHESAGADLALAHLATDPAERIEADFRITAPLRERVLFWASIYSRYHSKIKVLHDRNHPGIVYGYIDFSPLYLKYKPIKASILAARVEKEILSKLKASILAAASLCPSALNEADQEALRVHLSQYNLQSKADYETLAGNIRGQLGQSDQFREALVRSEKFLPWIEKVFESHGLPRALTRLPFVESSFNSGARSKSGAIGLWQFMPNTAREMIHPTNRRHWHDPIRQTKAAARFIKRNRAALPDWASTVTSYNSGFGRVTRLLAVHVTGIGAIEARGSDGELGFAGKNFYAELLAANIVEAYKKELFSAPARPKRLGALEVTKTARDGS